MPLKGIKILDLSRVLAGPYCAQILGDLGADVIKVEQPIVGDDTRHWGESYYLSANRNKRGIALDFKKKKDLERIFKLIAKADVVLENFKVGGLKKFELDYENLSKKHPKLIYCSISGFGQDGPMSKEPGYDFLIQGLGGLMSITGPDSNSPTKSGIAIVDLCSGLYATISILTALREREKSGLGQHCTISLLDTQASLLSYIAMAYMADKKIPKPLGNRHPTIAPYESFQTEDRPLIITIGNNQQFKSFSKILGMNWHEDAQFKSNENRVKNQKELSRLITEKLKKKPRDFWMKLFEGQSFAFGPIQNLKEMADNPQVIFNKLFQTMDDGKTPNIKSPLDFSRTGIKKYRRPPKLNEHEDADFED
ncbi:MAG: Crotonobetainyl-CoA:carnitine CoA-transferase CaiB [Bacteriovoracaceae bacterium]|nr:Crotonobetainyl-CoA:carnitine CoA-transferase CaiB [Bacteriovoracaceae bacterium]